MSVTIVDIQRIRPERYAYYYFDANCWITQLLSTNKSLSQIQRNQGPLYLNFFSGVITSASAKNIKTVPKPGTHNPRIIVTNLLVSEIFNRYIRICWDVYKKVVPSCIDFKKDYRNTPDYTKSVGNLSSDFEAFKDYVELETDYIKEIDPYTLLQSISSSNDFNDIYSYYQLIEIKKNKSPLAIVTDDSDFTFHDIDIITANKKLLRLK
jgi:hypothetical protein